MRAADLTEIRGLPLFATMSDESFESLARVAYLQSFPPQVDLIEEGSSADFLHVVVDGLVELFASWNRRETTMGFVGPVTTFILAATIRDAPYLMSARTLQRSRVLLLPSEDVRAVFGADAAFARAVVEELAGAFRGCVRHAKDLKLRNATERLAAYLLRRQAETGGAAQFDLGIEKRRLASWLGMTPENLSRAIRTLQAYGVEIDGARVTLVRAEDLARIAKPSPLIDRPEI